MRTAAALLFAVTAGLSAWTLYDVQAIRDELLDCRARVTEAEGQAAITRAGMVALRARMLVGTVH